MGDLLIRVVTGVLSGAMFLGIYFLSKMLFSVLLIAIFFEILLFEWPRLARNNKKLWFLVPLYPTIPFLSLLYLNHFYRSVHLLLPLYPFFVCWIADTFAYLCGVGFGRHKIWPSLSPKKSWEGLFGSIVAVVIFNLFYGIRPVLSLFLALGAFFGDIFESYLKRRAGVKDTGSILPGHGGLLDRFDSVFFVSLMVVFWLVICA